jgi:dihydroxyacetone kinase-like predicted kinase
VQEILAAVNSSGYRELIVLPNNRNIIPTAKHVQELTSHTVTVIPTETVPQGIGALLAFNFQADMQTNLAAMEQAAHSVHTVEVTRSVRDAEVNGLHVKSGHWLGLYDGRVVVTNDSAEEALLSTLPFAPVDGLEIVTIYHGAGASEESAHTVAAEIREAHPGLDVEVVIGGQAHYPYVVSLE